MAIPPTLRADPKLRELLLEFYLEWTPSPELGNWLQDLGQNSHGTIDERRARIRANTKYLTMPAAEFPAQTEHYLAPLSAMHLENLCERLAVAIAGNKGSLYRRIMREVHIREGWMPRISESATDQLRIAHVAAVLERFPLSKRGENEKDYYPVIFDELQEVFGQVYEQLPVAHGTTLKIDFHVGEPQGHGVGVEVKLPCSNSDVQRALGQLDQYQRRYGENLLLFVILDFLKPEIAHSLQRDLKQKGITVVYR